MLTQFILTTQGKFVLETFFYISAIDLSRKINYSIDHNSKCRIWNPTL